MTISAIVSVDKNMGIGYKGQLIVRNPIDMAFFCGYTQGKVCIAGHNTLKTLPNLANRVVKSAGWLDLWEYDGVVIMGGAKTYAKHGYAVDELFITINEVEVEQVDTYFPIQEYQHLTKKDVMFRGEYEGMKFKIERWTEGDI